MFNAHRKSHSGFSLIEVMIAVVVLSVGLLALSALQVSLLRVSGETKAQTTALSLAQERLEDLREFHNSGGFLAITDGAASPVTITGTAYTPTWEVRRFVYLTSEFNDIGDGNEAITNTAVKALNAAYNTNLQFKAVGVSVTWQDSTGATKSVFLSDLFSSTSSTDSLSAGEEGGGDDRGPQRRNNGDPADDAGVIAFAVGTDNGNDQSVAASDPRPQTYGTSGKVATKFTVQTYVEDGLGFLIQKDYETAVVSCRCTRQTGSSTVTTREPSYWDGDGFTVPNSVTGKTYGSETNGVAQDGLCTICCRDHHDRSGATVLYDPFRPVGDYSGGGHNHYLRSGSRTAATFTLASASGNTYDEACRMVRIGGLFNVTTDPQLENMVVLNTTSEVYSGSNIVSAQLAAGTKTAYVTFALEYIDDLWDDINTNGVSQAALTDYTPSPDGLSQTDPLSLVQPGSPANAPYPQKMLFSRAMFVDWISPEAQEKLECVGQSSDSGCLSEYPEYITKNVAQILPFLAINLTGLGEWSTSSSSLLSVTNQAIPTDVDTDYIRGRYQGVAVGNATGTISSYRGPVGLTDQEPISYHDKGIAADNSVLDARVLMTDARGFTMSGAAAATNNRFVAQILNPNSDANLKTGQLTLSSADYSCSRGAGTAGTDPTDSSALSTSEHLCIGPESTTTVNLSLTGYNFITVTCPNGGYSAVDARDPATICKKNNGATASPTSVQTFYYKVCSVVPTTAVGQFTVTLGTPTRSISNYPDTEYTPFTITANSNSALDLIRFNVSLYPVGTTCP